MLNAAICQESKPNYFRIGQPYVKSVIFSHWNEPFSVQNQSDGQSLIPVILPSILESHKERVREMLEAEFEGPTEHASTFEPYNVLITKQVWWIEKN